MKIIKTKLFAKWATKNDVTESSLYSAGEEINHNNYDANYGGGVLKKRIATKGRGKSSSVRTIVAFKKGVNCFFMYGFEKNAKSNISTNEEKALKLVAKTLFEYSASEIQEYIKTGSLVEVKKDE